MKCPSLTGRRGGFSPHRLAVLFIHSARSYHADYPYCPHPKRPHTLHNPPSFCKNIINILPSALLRSWKCDLGGKMIRLPTKDRRESWGTQGKVSLGYMFSPSSFGQWQVAATTICKSKPFSEQTNSKRGETNKHEPEKYWKLKSNHFRRPEKKPKHLHIKRTMAPWTKPAFFSWRKLDSIMQSMTSEARSYYLVNLRRHKCEAKMLYWSITVFKIFLPSHVLLTAATLEERCLCYSTREVTES